MNSFSKSYFSISLEANQSLATAPLTKDQHQWKHIKGG